MIDQDNEKQEKNHREPISFYDASRRILLAAIGAVAFAQDEVEDFVSRLVERGEIAENDGKKLINEILEKRNIRKQDIESEANKHINKAFERWNVPTKHDIDELRDKIAELTKKVEEIKKIKE